MNQNFVLLIKSVFAFLDLLILNSVFFLLKWYQLRMPLSANEGEYLYLWIFLNVLWLACCGLYSLYEGRNTSTFENFIRRTFSAYLFFAGLTLIYLYFSKQLIISRAFVSTFLLAFPACLMLNRVFYLLFRQHFKVRESFMKRVLIIGYNDIAKKLAAYFERNYTQMEVVGFCEESQNVRELSHYPIINTPDNAIRASKELQIAEIYSTILPEQDKRIYDLMNLADQACIRFKLVPDFGLFVNQPMHLNYLSEMPILTARSEPLDDITNRIRKRIFDIAVSVLMIVFVLSWLVPLVALLIWIESRGPIFFVQKRSGLNNKPFNCIKFRSMYVNNDSHTRSAARNDARLTRIGKFIRKTNIDEFPQFLNVLKGEMSVVGPRPHMLKHTEQYSSIIKKFMVRQFLKPGITGWAQINGHRGSVDIPEEMQRRVDHDLWYMENWSLALDFRIVFLTFYNMLRGEKNAY
jgi:putative colanic acid biosynthesis UDP-glucose lipid carrier transferase